MNLLTKALNDYEKIPVPYKTQAGWAAFQLALIRGGKGYTQLIFYPINQPQCHHIYTVSSIGKREWDGLILGEYVDEFRQLHYPNLYKIEVSKSKNTNYLYLYVPEKSSGFSIDTSTNNIQINWY